MAIIGLVVEGPHDLIMLKPIIEHQFQVAHGEAVTFIPIQPSRDATGSYSHGGWSRVMAWCLANAGANLKSLYEPLFAGDPKLDVIVVHLDGDALDLIRPHVTAQLPTPPVSVADRLSGLETAINTWLAPEAAERRKLVMAFPTMQTESWILAAENHPQAGETANAKDIFRANHRQGKPAGPLYERRTRNAAHGFANIGNVCQSYTHFEAGVAAVQW